MSSDPVVVVGGGHNGLVAACYLAKVGKPVVVLEAADKPGGGSRTDETIPGYRFNTHAAAHNIINMTRIPAELGLAGAGLEYLPMDPFATGVFRDGRVVRFSRDVEQAVASIAEHSRADAEAYRAFMHRAIPLVKTAVTGLESGSTPGGVFKAAVSKLLPLLLGVKRAGGPVGLFHDLVMPYGALLETALPGDLTRAPVASFASHSSAGPHAPGGSFYVFWQAAYHLFGQWHPRGGSSALTTALISRLEEWGGEVRTGTAVEGIEARTGRATGVLLEGGKRLAASAVVTAIDVQTALLDLLDPPLGGKDGTDLAAAHRGNAVQLVVHLATDQLPPYPNARPGDWNGLQSHVDTLDELRRGFQSAEARRLPDPVPTYCFTPSVYDDSLAPAGGAGGALARSAPDAARHQPGPAGLPAPHPSAVRAHRPWRGRPLHLRRLDRSGRWHRRKQLQGSGTRAARGATVTAELATRRFALSRAEWVTTAVAGVVSSAAYVKAGYPYLARGVAGDLAGFLVLGVAGSIAGARVKHEAAVCLSLIGVVLAIEPGWPLQVSEPVWWGLFSAGLMTYVVVRRRIWN